ncbi:hypothetical protein [Paracoccus sp. KR1-242]|uniref:hypothetical protein n=1 Tax=Paracoccus sp. KR1-242 TaxID=3410028 RepID=UPI003C07C41C
MGDLAHLRETFKRQSTPGSLVLIMCAAVVFGPRAWDTFRGEPWIDNHLLIAQNSGGGIVVEDQTKTNAPVHGLRFTSAEAEDGTVICSTEHSDIWLGENKRFWRLSAFIGCEQPVEPYRVCSRFSIRSESDRRRSYGPFCSAMTKPFDDAPPG